MAELKATVEITGCIVRILVPGAADPYAYDAAVAVVGDEGVATIKALTTPAGGYTIEHRKVILQALKDAGFRTAIWRRRKFVNGASIVVDKKQPL